MSATLISGKYEIIRKVGQGGMGTVYQVRHTSLDTVLALKLLPDHLADNPDLIARFQREARVMAQLKHENIVKVYDITRDGNLYYLVEEYIDGQHLGEYLHRRGPLPAAEALAIAQQVARALDYAHQRGVIHRDIKPSNVLIEQNEPVRALLADFGIAKVDDAGDRTQTGMLLGTVKYAAPEQIGYRSSTTRGEVDARADIYALGLVLYEMCEGRQYFAGLEHHEIIVRLVYDKEPLQPSFLRPVPPRVGDIIARAIARDPGDRYQRMADLLRDIDACTRDLAPPLDSPTLVVPLQTSSPATNEDFTAEELDERIRALQLERDRRLAVAALTRAQNAREQASGAGAPVLAPGPYQQAVAREAEAAAALRENRCTQATAHFDEAVKLFLQAATEARNARTQREAEAARGAMVEAKRQAELERASDRARTAYGRALSIEDEAEEQLGRRAYEEARRAFTEAQRLYEEARTRAREETQRAAAVAAGAEIDQARATAVEAEAGVFAAAQLALADERVRSARNALEQRRFEEARSLFANAREAFTAAAETARQEQASQRALAEEARVGAATARQAADRAEAKELAPTAYGQALLLTEQAATALQERRYQQAREIFQQASRQLTDAAEHASGVARLRRDSAAAREAMLANKQRAGDAEAPEYAAESFERAVAIEGDAERRHALGADAEALRGFQAAAEAFAEAATRGRDRAKAAAERSRLELQAVRAEAETAGGADLARDDLRAAEQKAGLAETALAEGNAARAHRLFVDALKGYQLAVATARGQRLRAEALGAKQEADRQRNAAEQADAQRYAAQAYSEGLQALQEGERSLAAEAHDSARAAFARAATRLHAATSQAGEARQREAAELERERQRQAADEARARAESALQGADQAKAPTLAPTQYQRGIALGRQASQALAEGQSASARELFDQAAQALAEAAQAATSTASALAAAGQAREAMQAARSQAEQKEAADTAPTLYGRAQALDEQAEQRWERKAYAEAQLDYQTAERLYQEAAQRAADVRARELGRAAASAAREKAQQARVQAASAGANRYASEAFKRASLVFDQGDQALGSGTEDEAVARFAEAEVLFQQSGATAETARQEEERAAAKATALKAADASREAMLSARRTAEEASAATEAAGTYQQATRQAEDGESLLARQLLGEAAERFEKARQVFAAATSEAAASRQAKEKAEASARAEAAEQARTEAERAKREAEKARREALERERAEAEARAKEAAERERKEAERQQREAEKAKREAAEREHQKAQAQAKEAAAREKKEAEQRAQQEAAERRARERQAAEQKAPPAAAVEATVISPAVRPNRDVAAVPPPETIAATGSRTPLYAGGAVLALVLVAAAAWYFTRPTPMPPVEQTKVEPRVQPSPAVAPTAPVAEAKPTQAPVEVRLAWDKVEPEAAQLQVAEGKAQSFNARIAGGEQLARAEYVWFLDGKKQAEASATEGSTWTYEPGFDAAGKQYDIRVTASAGGKSIDHAWKVEVANVNRPPVIESAAPEASAVTVAPGAEQKFTVTATDADTGSGDKLAYEWKLNGKAVSSAPSWTLQNLKEENAEVTVRVTDAAGGADVSRSWKVSLLKPEPAANRPPRLVGRLPATNKIVTVEEGDSVELSVKAEDPDAGDQLAYLWRLDGAEAGRKSSLKFEAPQAVSEPKTHRIAVEVTDREGLKASPSEWKIEVRPSLPRIAEFSPKKSTLNLLPGEALEFVASTGGRNDQAEIRKEWTIDGKAAQPAANGRLRLPGDLPSGKHTVEVAAVDTRGRRSKPQRWTVDVQERLEPTPVPQIAAKPPSREEPKPPPPPPQGDQVTEADARKWLSRFQDAWQRKDVETLRAIGVVSGESQAAALERALGSYGRLQVSIRNERIEIDGETATVSFDRTDSDETGRQLNHPRQSYRIRKGAGGVVAVSR